MTSASKNSSVNTASFLNKQRILTHKLVCFNLQISSKCFKTVEISFSVLELCFFPLKILKMFQFSLTTSVSVPSFATSYDLSLLLSAKFVVGVPQSFCFSSGNEGNFLVFLFALLCQSRALPVADPHRIVTVVSVAALEPVVFA